MSSAIRAGVVFLRSTVGRRRVFGLALIAMLLIVVIAGASGAAIAAGQSDPSPESACSEIRSGVSRMARAERAQADALQLAGQAGNFAPVASQLNDLLARVAALRDTLHKVSQSRLTHEADVANCLKLGYQALYEAQKLTTEVEQILLLHIGIPLSAERRRDEGRPRSS